MNTRRVLLFLLGISALPAYAKLSLDSVAGAQTCTAADVIDWGLCFDTVKVNTNTSAQAAQEAWNNVTSSSDRLLIESGYYCNAVKNALVVAAQCVKPCTNDNKDYFGREQLATFCETGLNVTTFATIASFSTAQIAYSCSQPPLNCTGLINAQLQATLNSQGSSGMISLSGYIAFILVLISMWSAM